MEPRTFHLNIINLFVYHYFIVIVRAMKKLDPLAAMGAAGVTDIEKLSKWVTESRLDPNDPSNADLVFLFQVHVRYVICTYYAPGPTVVGKGECCFWSIRQSVTD